jgi:signal transduction histidine kinase
MIVASNELWLAENDGIVRIKRWEPDRGMPADYAIFTRGDGMRSAECTAAGGPHMTITRDGRLWVATEQGLAMIDLPRLPRDAGKPVVYVRDIVVGQKSQRPGDRLVLPPGTSHLELAFAPVELSAPQRIRLQYKLDGVDDGWLDAPPSHVATYSGMPPGSHTFHVRATNRDGVWDLVGITYQVIQEPFLYQTAWFQALGVAAFLGMLCGLYWYRMRRLAHEFNVRLEERVGERTRIARELHDTLLQNFHGLLLRFQGAYNHLPSRPEDARKALGAALDRGAEAITAARDTVQELRSPRSAANELPSAITALSEELRTVQTEGPSPSVEVQVEGAGRELHPILRDEIYRIAAEALRNAFRHAEATRIGVAIRYGDQEFRIAVKDNGKGIDPEILKQGSRPGHWGLPGMRERAEAIGTELDVCSSNGNGTDVGLRVPAAIAYAFSPARRPSWFNRKNGEANGRDSNPRGG